MKIVKDITTSVKKKILRTKLKGIAQAFVQNDKIIKRATELKLEQKSLRKQFDSIRAEINTIEVENTSDDDVPSKQPWDIELCLA